MFKGSTEHVMKIALPQLVTMDAALIADRLVFSIPGVPDKMYEKAKYYILNKEKHLHIMTYGQGADNTFTFFLLSASCEHFKKIDELLVGG